MIQCLPRYSHLERRFDVLTAVHPLPHSFAFGMYMIQIVMGWGFGLSLCVPERGVLITSHRCWTSASSVTRPRNRARPEGWELVEVVCFKGAFSTFTNSISKSWVKAGVNAKVNLRIARRTTLKVLFQGKSHHTDQVLLLWNQLHWQSCSLSWFSYISPWSGAHTWNELSSQKHVLPV